MIALKGTAGGYNITVGGSQRGDDEEQQLAYPESIAAEGVTWWHEYIAPDAGDFDAQRRMLEWGPLRIG